MVRGDHRSTFGATLFGARVGLTCGGVFLLIVYGSWFGIRAIDPTGAAFPLPLGFGREVDVNYWTTVDGLGVALWYQDTATNKRLVAFEIPVW